MRLLLCTDMDRTVIPNGHQPEATDARLCFRQFCEHPEVTLVYVTGRHLALMEDAVEQYQLPTPDYAITDVGTRIYQRHAQDWCNLADWQNEIDLAWNSVQPRQIIRQLVNIRGLTLQPEEKQNPHKISFYADTEQLTEADCLTQVKDALQPLEIQANLIWSVDETTDTGLLDILPPLANKHHAIEFLQQHLGFVPQEVVFAGDSGNDLPVIISPIQAVLVANATEQVKHQAWQLVQQHHTESAFYQATNQQACEGNYAAGVLQGVWHFRPELKG
mgnify:CR=1 FL=1